MSNSSTLIKAVSMTALISSSVMAEEPPRKLNGLRIAVVKDAIGSPELSSGNYVSAIDKLSSAKALATKGYERSMGLCAAFIKVNDHQGASQACTDAVNALNEMDVDSNHGRYLTSITYSNRAIYKYLADDTTGALDDMTNALLIDSNEVVKSNFVKLKATLFARHTDDSINTSYSVAE